MHTHTGRESDAHINMDHAYISIYTDACMDIPAIDLNLAPETVHVTLFQPAFRDKTSRTVAAATIIFSHAKAGRCPS